MTTYAVCILAGGEATRLPGKLERAVAGTPLLARVYRNVGKRYPTYIAARSTFNDPLEAQLDCPLIIDRWPGRGPLGGLLSAFGEIREDRVFVVAGDAPNADAQTLEALRVAWQPGDAAVAAGDGARIEPLLALYDRRKFLDAAWPVFSGSASVQEVARALGVRTARVPARALTNINTAADLEVVT